MIGSFISSRHLFGLPERSDKFLLKTTSNGEPYRLYNVDLFPHDEWNMQGLYSSIPYITGHNPNHDESILYYNSAETWVDIIRSWGEEENEDKGKLVNFISESG